MCWFRIWYWLFDQTNKVGVALKKCEFFCLKDVYCVPIATKNSIDSWIWIVIEKWLKMSGRLSFSLHYRGCKAFWAKMTFIVRVIKYWKKNVFRLIRVCWLRIWRWFLSWTDFVGVKLKKRVFVNLLRRFWRPHCND